MSLNFRAASTVFLLLFSATSVAQSPVRVERALDRTIVKRIEVTGTVTSPRTATLSTAVAGLVVELDIDEGHRVVAGDALLSLDAELAQLALERALAEVRQRETAVADARRRLAEAEALRGQNGIAQTQVESLRAEVDIEEAALMASSAAAREQQAIVARHALKAPFNGVVSARLTEVGEWVNPGDGLLELVAVDNLRFDFRVSQENFAALIVNTPVKLALDALPGHSIPGHVSAIVPVKDPSARTFLVRAIADATPNNVEYPITPGMSARGIIHLESGQRGVTISRDAMLRFPDGRTTVWVVESAAGEPLVRERVVLAGVEYEGLVEVRRGLAHGDLVVVRGNETLQEGQSVSILESDN